MRKIIICHVIGDFVNGGVESVIYNYFTHMDLTQFEVHIIAHDIKVEECAERFRNLGFSIHIITPKRNGFFKSCNEMYKIFSQYKFDIIHSHLTEWACVPMFLGWLCGTKVRINHSHMAEKPKGLIKKIYYSTRIFFGRVFSTDYFACGRDAGEYLFGKKLVREGKVTLLPNAVDYNKFRFCSKIRDNLRKKEEIGDETIVVGHVGRYYEQKNHSFLIDVFEAFHKIKPNSVLLLLGDGELMPLIKQKVKDRDLDCNVRFLGNRNDVADWYQVMDVFILPSLYEGLPVVGVEAQATGLPCIFSREVTVEIQISPNAFFLPLESGVEKWANKINEVILNNENRTNVILDYDRYDINNNASELYKFYLKAIGIH